MDGQVTFQTMQMEWQVIAPWNLGVEWIHQVIVEQTHICHPALTFELVEGDDELVPQEESVVWCTLSAYN